MFDHLSCRRTWKLLGRLTPLAAATVLARPASAQETS